MGVCTKEWEGHGRGMTAEVLMATPCTKSLQCESGGRKCKQKGRETIVGKDRDAKRDDSWKGFFEA